MTVRIPSINLFPIFVLLAIECLTFTQGLIVSDQLAPVKFNKALHRIDTITLHGVHGDGVLRRTVGVQLCLAQDSDANQSNDDSDNGASRTIEEELEELNNQLSLIEAIEARNESQLDSFIDAEDQWNSLEEEERTFLESKDIIIQRLELLTEQMVQLWMGQKSMEG